LGSFTAVGKLVCAMLLILISRQKRLSKRFILQCTKTAASLRIMVLCDAHC
jgi:hypothetical protein